MKNKKKIKASHKRICELEQMLTEEEAIKNNLTKLNRELTELNKQATRDAEEVELKSQSFLVRVEAMVAEKDRAVRKAESLAFDIEDARQNNDYNRKEHASQEAYTIKKYEDVKKKNGLLTEDLKCMTSKATTQAKHIIGLDKEITRLNTVVTEGDEEIGRLIKANDILREENYKFNRELVGAKQTMWSKLVGGTDD